MFDHRRHPARRPPLRYVALFHETYHVSRVAGTAPSSDGWSSEIDGSAQEQIREFSSLSPYIARSVQVLAQHRPGADPNSTIWDVTWILLFNSVHHLQEADG